MLARYAMGVRFALLASFTFPCGACEDAAGPEPAEADASQSPATAEDAADRADASTFDACVASLEACEVEDVETGCKSVRTRAIPLSDGSTWGSVDLLGGPYGAYVAWNQGQEFANPVNPSEADCAMFAAVFGEPESVTQDVLDLRGAELGLYTVFRPACMDDGERYPVIIWGNGTCGQTGGYAPLLATLASHGFVVVAANSRFTNAGNREMSRALDFAEAANRDPASHLYQRLDLQRVGAMGHSQGAAATMEAAKDPRVKAVILWNGGGAPTKRFLSVSGERDIGEPSPVTMASTLDTATTPGAWLYFHEVLVTGGRLTGHLTLMQQPERVTDVTVAWWNYVLRDSEEARAWFVGERCTLCENAGQFEFGQKGLR